MKSSKRIAMALVLAGGLVASECAAAGFSWGNVAIGGGGFVSAIVPSLIEKDLFYARTDVGGAYRWDESSQKWIQLMDWVDVNERGLLGVDAIAVDPIKPGCFYMVTGTSYWNQDSSTNELVIKGKDTTTTLRGRSAFLRTKDYGATWEKIYTWDENTKWFSVHGNGMGRGNGEALVIDPNNSDVMFYGSKDKGLWKSVNNGTTWSHVNGFTTAAGYDTTWNGSGFSFVAFAPGSSTTLYAGFAREGNSVFRSTDGGATWAALPIPAALRSTAGGSAVRLMPQRIAIAPNDSSLFITFADGAGPHTMAWSEGWGMIYDGFGRGAVLKYDVGTATWSDISPADYIDDNATGVSKYDSLNLAGNAIEDGHYNYIGPYGGISINPANPLEMAISTEGYTGAQYWNVDGTWKDQWGTQIFYTSDGGKKWYASFKYQGSPAIEQMSENGIGWMLNSSIHWSGSIVIDPFDSKKVWITSGNGVFRTDDITAFNADSTASIDKHGLVDPWATTQNQVWKVFSHGIEEVVPMEVVSIPGGPMVSVIGDYDGFRHDDISAYPAKRHQTSVSGMVSIGTTRGLAFAPKSGVLVKVSDARNYKLQYNTVPIAPMQYSKDSGSTWTVETYTGPNTEYSGGTAGISTDGAVALWTPMTRTLKSSAGKDSSFGGDFPIFRNASSAWSSVAGIDGAYVVGDPENANVFYAYKKNEGAMYVSTDKGVTFAAAGSPGKSDYRKFRLAPGREGDIWVPIANGSAKTGGLVRSIDGGKTFTTVAGVGYCEAVGFGKAATGASYPAIYVYATIGGTTGVFQSVDEGVAWTRVNDDAHEYGGLANGEFVVGDMNTFGVVYMSTAGNGIAARKVGSATGVSGKPLAASRGLAQLRGRSLQIVVAGEPVDVRVLGFDGRTLKRVQYSSSTSVALSTLMPSQGMYVLEARSGSRTLLSRTVSQMH